MSPINRPLLMTCVLLLALFLSLGLLTTLPAQAQESSPARAGDLVPLPDNCTDTTPDGSLPACCAFGYVLVDGEAVEGAEVQISSASGSLTVTTTLSSDPDYPEPFYATSLSDTLAVEVGDFVTFTVTYDGFTVTRVHQAQAGSQQVDLVIDTFEGGHFEQTDFVSQTVLLAHGSTENVPVDNIGDVQYLPILALDRNSDKLYAAWVNDDGGYHIAFSQSSDGGQSWSETQLLHYSPINFQVLNSLLVGDDGTLYMAWAEGQSLNSFDVYLSHSSDGGQSWSSPVRVNDYIFDTQIGATLAIDGNNHLYMAWMDFRNHVSDIYFAKSTDGGQNWSPSIQINDAIQFSTQYFFNTPSLVVDSGGENVYIAWTDHRHDNPDIYLANSSDSGETFEPNMRLNDNQQNSQRNPRLAISDEGTVVAVWADERSGSSRIYFAKSTDHGLTWNNRTINDHAFITEQKEPNVVIDGHGQIYVAWHEPQPCRNSPNLLCHELILARSADEGERWYPIVHPSDQDETLAIFGLTKMALPALAVDSNEQLIVAWQDNRDNASSIYSARWPDLTHRYSEGTYLSKVYDAGETVGWQTLDWAATLPAESAITFEVRTANTLDNWSAWQAFSASPADLSALPHGQYLEWRAHLSSAISTTTPSLEAVHLTVHSPAVTPEIQTSESVLHFNAEEGGENPAPQLLEVMNGGTGSFNWTATMDVEWLTLSAISGTAPATIEVGTLSSELAPGTYFGEITLTAPGVPNSPHTVHVRLTVVPEGMSSWTLMFYLAGDNDLAFALKNKPLALQAAAQHANLNILVLLDGMGSDDTRLYHVLPDELRTFSPDDLPWLADEMDMGNPETLRDFVSWGLNNYAADFSYLNIANHGKGIQGIAWDSQADPDTFISVSELSQALKAATNTADDDPDNDRRLDLLHYDACLMAMLEGAYDVSGAANYLVASQNLGWSLFAFTDYAQAAAQASAPLDLASQIGQIYHDSLTPSEESNRYPHTIAAVDLLQVENVNQQLNEFITLLDSSLITHTVAISEARLETQKFDSRDYFVIDNQDEYLDLYNFVEHLQQRLPEPAIQSSALALMESISQTVMVEHHLSDEAYGSYWDLEEAHGLSIYFPSAPGGEGSLYEQYVEGDLFTFSEHSQYDEFLASVLSGVTPDDSDDDDVPPVGEYSPYAIHKTAPTSAEADAPITYTLTITNSSPLTATNLLITDTLPTDATYLSGGTLEGNIVSWLVPSLVPSDTISVQFAVSASQTITNSDYGVMTDAGFYAGTEAIVTEITAPSDEDVVLALSALTYTTSLSDTFELVIEVRAGEQEVDGASAHLNFDPTYLEVVSIIPSDELSLLIQNQFDNTSGQLDFAAGQFNAPFPTGTFTLATVTFRTKALTGEDGTAIEFNTTLPRQSDVTFAREPLLDGSQESTIFITNASLIGAVMLEGRPAPPDERWRVPLRVSLTIPGESTPAYQFTPTTDENGHFSLSNIPLGSYDVRIKKSTTLQTMQLITLTTAHNDMINFGLLPEGDANDDNNVTIVDFSILRLPFAKCEGDADYNPQADFNGDNCVNILDFSLLSSNFGQGGEHRPEGGAARQVFAPTGDAKLIIDHPIIQAQRGNSYRVAVRLAADSPIDGAAAYIHFDPSLLKVNSITAGDTFELALQNEFDNQSGMIAFAAGTLTPPLPGAEGLGVRGDLLVIEFEALADGESPLTFQFDASRTTDVTSSGQSVLSDYVDGSEASIPTALEVAQLAVHEPVNWGWMALLVCGLLVVGVGREAGGLVGVKK